MSSIDSSLIGTDEPTDPITAITGVVSSRLVVAAVLAVLSTVVLAAITSLGGGDVSAGYAVPLRDTTGTLLLGLLSPLVFFPVLLIAEWLDAEAAN